MEIKTQPVTRHSKVLQDIRLRKADNQELNIFHKGNTVEKLKSCVTHSEATKCFFIDGKPVAILGCNMSHDNSWVVPWMVGADDVKQYPKLLCRIGKNFLKLLLWKWKLVYNYVDARNLTHIKWLKYIGFQFLPEKDVMVNGYLMHYFEKRREDG